MKVVLQVDSTDGFRSLMKRLKSGHIAVLYQGSLATAFSAIVGHYPWVSTFVFNIILNHETELNGTHNILTSSFIYQYPAIFLSFISFSHTIGYQQSNGFTLYSHQRLSVMVVLD